MIGMLGAPTVCVIDDEEDEYAPVLNALWRQGISATHVLGSTIDSLPPRPFDSVRLVLTDLHLTSSSSEKDQVAHTANVFLKTISIDSGPVLVVIWSKYSGKAVGTSEFAAPPDDDQPSLSDLFKDTLLNAEPRLQGRLVFTEMSKPKLPDRPAQESWVADLENNILLVLRNHPDLSILWSWQHSVEGACRCVLRELAQIASTSYDSTNEGEAVQGFGKQLRRILQVLVREHAGIVKERKLVSRSLSVILSHLLSDQLEHSTEPASEAIDASWISGIAELPLNVPFSSQLNTTLLTSCIENDATPFMPGTVYRITRELWFQGVFDVKIGELHHECYLHRDAEVSILDRSEWREKTTAILIELSPACDVHQGTRRQAMLIAGLLVPEEARIHAKPDGAFLCSPSFKLRCEHDNTLPGDYFLVLCSRFKVTLSHGSVSDGLLPWFRVRELPTASIRNWYAAHSARIGYTSLQ